MNQIDKILDKENPLYLNSKTYVSKDWRPRKECMYFTNRKLIKNEIVLDFDDIKNDKDFKLTAQKVLLWLMTRNILFWMYKSSDTGLHVHLLINKITHKIHKKAIVELIQSSMNIKIDNGPCTKGWVRAEESIHPIKKTKKTLLFTNIINEAFLAPIFYINTLSYTTYQKVLSKQVYDNENYTPNKESFEHRTISFMKNNSFANGRKRVMFCLISWWKSRGYSKDVIYKKTKDWLQRQNYYINDRSIYSSINSSTGMVRDKYRIELLSELGFDIKKKQDNKIKANKPVGF